jgi:hypothetical protein
MHRATMMKLEVANKSLKALVDGFPRSDLGGYYGPCTGLLPRAAI